MEDNQLFNLAIPAPVLDGRPSFRGDAERLRKYCNQGLRVPLRVTMTNTQTLQFRGAHEGGGGRWCSPQHTLKHWSEHLIPSCYPNNPPPFDVQLLSCGMHEVSTLLVLTGGGCSEADVGSDALEIRLLKAKVEPKRCARNIPWRDPDRVVMFVVHGNLANV